MKRIAAKFEDLKRSRKGIDYLYNGWRSDLATTAD